MFNDNEIKFKSILEKDTKKFKKEQKYFHEKLENLQIISSETKSNSDSQISDLKNIEGKLKNINKILEKLNEIMDTLKNLKTFPKK